MRDESIADLRAFGITDLPEDVDHSFEVWPENADAIQMFTRLQTQWRTTFGAVLGLDYAAVKSAFDILDPQDPQALFADLQIMERAALPLMNERVATHGSSRGS